VHGVGPRTESVKFGLLGVGTVKNVMRYLASRNT
jgi:hypothetical protein